MSGRKCSPANLKSQPPIKIQENSAGASNEKTSRRGDRCHVMEQSKKKQAQLISLRLLAASPKTSQELKKKLHEKGFPESLITETLREMEAQGILSDRSYAADMMARYRGSKPSGRRKIASEFKHHGIAQKIQDEVLAGYSPEEERAQAGEAGRQRWKRFPKLDNEKRKKRVFDFLMRRGFDYQIVRDVIRELSQDNLDEDGSN